MEAVVEAEEEEQDEEEGQDEDKVDLEELQRQEDVAEQEDGNGDLAPGEVALSVTSSSRCGISLTPTRRLHHNLLLSGPLELSCMIFFQGTKKIDFFMLFFTP